jgi:hypothetical protein
MPQKQKAATRTSAAKTNLKRQYSNDVAAQRVRVRDFLQRYGSLSTLDARHLIDVMHPAARVMELRRFGHKIATVWAQETTPEGARHRVARYHLMSEVRA